MLVRISKKLRERGVEGTAADLYARLRNKVRYEEDLILLLKDLDEVVPVGKPTGVTVEDLRREHLPLLSQLNRERRSPRDDKRFRDYVASGFHGFVALLDGAAVGYYWWVDATQASEFPDLRDFGLGIELGPGEVYGSDFYILEAQRNGRLAGEVLTGIEAGLRGRGYRWLWGYVRSDNRPARWLYETRGYERLWTHMRRKRFFVTRVTNTPDPRNYKGGLDVDDR